MSCQVSEDEPVAHDSDTQTTIATENMMVLGRQLQNPYSVENMQRAWDNLYDEGGRLSEQIEITTTHYYVKWLPQTDEELEILNDDSTLVLYDYPPDFEIVKEGDTYHDPEVPADRPTPLYGAVKVDYLFPSGVEYEILEDLFIPDDYSDEAIERPIADEAVVEALVDEALRITGNAEDEGDTSAENGRTARRSKWRPAGTIKAWDDNLGTSRGVIRYDIKNSYDYSTCGRGSLPCPTITTTRVPVYGTVTGSYQPIEGVEVRARRWFTTHKGIANEDGNYSCDGRFRRPANYSFKWKRYHFLIRDGWLSTAKVNGPKQRGNWDLNIRNGGSQEYYATIFRAAYHYYYKDIKNLRRPPKNGTFKTQLKIRAYLKDSGECGSVSSIGCHSSGWRWWGLSNPIKIYNYGSRSESRGIYATVIHELAHASHRNMSHWHFRNIPDNENRVKESWAEGVQW